MEEGNQTIEASLEKNFGSMTADELIETAKRAHRKDWEETLDMIRKEFVKRRDNQDIGQAA